MLWTRRRLIAGLAVAASGGARAEGSGDTYPLWAIGSGSATVFLCGDGPALTDRWTSKRVESAFARSSVFWREEPDPGAEDRNRYIARGVDHAHPLSTWLTPEQRDRVAAAAVSAGTTYASLEPLQPWLAAAALGQAYAQHRKPDPSSQAVSSPLAVLNERAKATGKPIRTEFAATDDLIAWASGMPPAAQVEYLFYIIEGSEGGPERLIPREKAWAAGDLSVETAEVERIRRVYPNLYVPLVVDRNRGWLPRIRGMLSAGGPAFVLVGVDHLVGPDSLPVMLAGAGLPAGRV